MGLFGQKGLANRIKGASVFCVRMCRALSPLLARGLGFRVWVFGISV